MIDAFEPCCVRGYGCTDTFAEHTGGVSSAAYAEHPDNFCSSVKPDERRPQRPRRDAHTSGCYFRRDWATLLTRGTTGSIGRTSEAEVRLHLPVALVGPWVQ